MAVSVIVLKFIPGCKKDDPVRLPELSTLPVTEITSRSAESGGEITADGGSSIIFRGVVWSTYEFPTFEENDGKTFDGKSTGKFTSRLTSLSPGTKYHVRAYAANIEGTSYGGQKVFITGGEPAQITTGWVDDITPASAISGGNITFDGGFDVTARGVVWSTSENPTVDENDGKSTDGEGTGEFISKLTGLLPGTRYHVRAYAVNNEGTSYGGQVVFRTYDGSVYDIDGNLYYTLIIGKQEWMAGNLRVTRYNNSEPIPSDLNDSLWNNTLSGAYAVYPHSGVEGIYSEEEMLDSYGALYNWYAVNTGDLCPAGWQAPDDSDWKQLTDYLIDNFEEITAENLGNTLKSCRQVDSPLGGKFSTGRHPRWNLHNTHYGTDDTGFSALPGGHRTNHGAFRYIGTYGDWWTSADHSHSSAWYWFMYNHYGTVNRHFYDKNYGFSVRCIRTIE